MRHLSYIFSIFVGAIFFASTVHALTVSPAKVEITGDPGTTIHGEIKLFNEQSDTRTFFSSFENFEPSGDTGAPHFIGATEGLATWLATGASVTLTPGERKTIPFSITIPTGTKPGGYFAAIFWGSQPPSGAGSGQVSIGGKIGVLVLLRVSGDVSEEAGLSEFSAKEGQKIFTTLPISFTYLVTNGGGDRIVPLGDLTIKNTLRMRAAAIPANGGEGSVLPGSTRKFEVTWGEMASTVSTETEAKGFFEKVSEEVRDFHFGWYTAHLDLTWGTTNQTGLATYHFFIFPWHLLVIVLIVLLLLWLILRGFLTRYKRSVIAEAMRTQGNG